MKVQALETHWDKAISPRNMRAYREQYWYGEHFLNAFLKLEGFKAPLRVLEIGPAEAGLLKYFQERGHSCVGLEYSPSRHENSVILNRDLPITLTTGDITDRESFHPEVQKGGFDLVILRDVIEHILFSEKQTALNNISSLMKPGALFFVSFPAKSAPYAGHQQVASSKFVKLPYIHLLPDGLYRWVLSLSGLRDAQVDNLLFIKDNRLSNRQFIRLAGRAGLEVETLERYIIRPCYESRFGMKRVRNLLPLSGLTDWLSFGNLYKLKKTGS